MLRWFLDTLDGEHGPPPDLDEARFAAAGLATGLTAAIGVAAARVGRELPVAWRPYVADQMAEVAARQERYRALLPKVLATLADAGVGAVPVKGAVLAPVVWPSPEARPMADIDLVVAPGDRSLARTALERAGLALASSEDWEDTFLAWGDGSVGRTDGESRNHNGKVEVHPGWGERLHNYLVTDGGLLLREARPGELSGARCLRLSPAALALNVIGHLAACVIRAEVRALNVVDAVLVLGGLDDAARLEFTALAGRLDPRLVEPGLWLVRCHRPELTRTVAAPPLPARAARLLAATPPANLLRDPNARTDIRWRATWVQHPAEAAAVARQFVAPSRFDLGAENRPVWRLQAARAQRGLRRLAAR